MFYKNRKLIIWGDPARLGVLRTYNPKYVSSIPTSSSSLLFCSLPRSMLRAFITHGIQTRVISSNAICRSLCLNAYQGGPSLLYAGYGHCILFVFWHFRFVFITGILFLFSVVLICYFVLFCVCVCFNCFLHKLLVISTMSLQALSQVDG